MNVFEYICLDNESKFRSKTVFSFKSIDELEEVIVDSSMISNVVVESHDIILVPVKCILNPFIRDEKHWLVMCEIRYPNGSIHKTNTRDPLKILTDNHSDYQLGITQQFVLFDKDEKKPVGWNDKIDVMKNYSSKLDFMKFSQPIIDIMIEYLIHVGIQISNIQMERMVSRWSVTFQPKSLTEACDDLFLFRYIIQRISANNNVIVNFHPDPIQNSKIYTRCYLNLSSLKMRDEDGIQEIDRACKKLELKHLEQFKSFCEYNGKHFAYGQNSSRYDVVIHLSQNNGGYIEDKRFSGDCDIYSITTQIVKTIELDYNIDSMSANLEQLKERFNYKNALNSPIIRPVISVNPVENKETISSKTKSDITVGNKKKEKAVGLTGLAKILKLNEDSDEEVEQEEKEGETKNMSRVEEIIHNMKKMNISHNILQSASAPKTVKPTLSSAPQEIASVDPHQGLTMLPSQPQMQQPQMQQPNMQQFNAPPSNMGVPVMPNSLYTLPSQI